jgi:uncharacterized protein YndB with AHSA1/START domain
MNETTAAAASHQPALPPLRLTIVVPLPPARAFRLFTEELATWWPIATHSVGGDRVAATAIEPRLGGRCFERWYDGEERVWGSVIAWEPPRRVTVTWHPGMPEARASEVEVRFDAEGAGTRVDLEHRGWEVLGEKAAATRASYDGGWKMVVGERYRAAAEAAAQSV